MDRRFWALYQLSWNSMYCYLWFSRIYKTHREAMLYLPSKLWYLQLNSIWRCVVLSMCCGLLSCNRFEKLFFYFLSKQTVFFRIKRLCIGLFCYCCIIISYNFFLYIVFYRILIKVSILSFVIVLQNASSELLWIKMKNYVKYQLF